MNGPLRAASHALGTLSHSGLELVATATVDNKNKNKKSYSATAFRGHPFRGHPFRGRCVLQARYHHHIFTNQIHSKKMSSSSTIPAMIPVPEQAHIYREMLFHLENPVELTEQQFDEYWPLVDTVWTKIGGSTVQRGGTIRVQHYECRLRKSKKTGTNVSRKEGRVVKPRITEVRVKDLCQVQMKITHTIPTSSEPVTVLLERKTVAVHTHSVDEIFRICGLPSIIKQVIATEVKKNYTAAQIFHALKGSSKIEGMDNLEAAGGSSLIR